MDTSSTPEFDGGTTLSAVLKNTTEPLYLLRPSTEILDSIVRIVHENAETPPIHVLATENDLRSNRQAFSTATFTADLIEEGDLTLTPTAQSGQGTLLVSEEAIYTVATVDEHQFVFGSTNVPTALVEYCSNCHGTQTFDLRTPGMTHLLESVEETFSVDIRDDLSAAIETSANSDEVNLDEATIALLVASKNELLLLYNLSRWGEDIRLCSKATFSRTKTELEDHGIIGSVEILNK